MSPADVPRQGARPSHRSLLTFLLAAGLGCLAACRSPSARPTPQPVAGVSEVAAASEPGAASADLIRREAQIESVEARLSPPGQPRFALITIRGLLHDGATRVQEIEPRVMDGEIQIRVSTARPRSAIASVALIPFERTVRVDVAGLPSGPCRVRVNQASTEVWLP